MRAVVLDPRPRTLRLTEDWPEPAAGSGQVLVRVRGVGICGSDLALLSGQRRAPSSPWIPGHEAFGEIVATGAGVPGARVGERVAIEPNFPCFSCPPCRAGLTSGCLRRVSLGFTAPGALAELIAVPARFAWPVPGDWSAEDAVCAEPVAVALAAIRRAAVSKGSRCLVLGAGSQGLLTCLSLIALGVTPYVLEPHDGRREFAAALGAIQAGAADDGFDTVFETSGSAAALQESVGRAATAATVMLVGLSGGPIPLDAETVVRRQLRIQGSLTYDHPGDFAAVVNSAGPALRPGRVLRACFPLDQAEQAFRAARDIPGKSWIQVP